MKLSKLFAAATVALGLASSAQAVDNVYIAGAPALRQQLTTAIEALVDAGGGSPTRAHNGSNIITANVVEWENATVGGNLVNIYLTYNGSAGGYQATAGSKVVRFLPAGLGNATGQTDVLTDLAATAQSVIPDFHIANEFQISTPWVGTNNTAYGPGDTTYASLTDKINGILPLRIVASPNAPPDLNLTPQLAKTLYTTGEIRLSQLTGNSTDYGKKVYALSRGIDSGVRTLWATNNYVGTSGDIISQLATVSPSAGPISGLVLTSGGTGYTTPPAVTINDTKGNGYASVPTVVISGGGGSGATANATVSGGKVTAITVNSTGSGYTSAPSVSINGGGFSRRATAVATISGGGVNAILLGSGATANATVSGGKVTGINLINGGSNFVNGSAPNVSFAGGGGKLAAATAVVTGGTTVDQVPYPAGNVIGVDFNEGNGGYPTFGPLLAALTSTLNLPGGNSGDIYVTILSDADAQVALAAGGKEVKWNGNLLGTLGTYGNAGSVTTSSAPNPSTGTASPALAYGQYELWGYSRLAHRTSLAGPQLATLTAINNRLKDFDAPVLLKDVNYKRTAPDGGRLQQGRNLGN